MADRFVGRREAQQLIEENLDFLLRVEPVPGERLLGRSHADGQQAAWSERTECVLVRHVVTYIERRSRLEAVAEQGECLALAWCAGREHLDHVLAVDAAHTPERGNGGEDGKVDGLLVLRPPIVHGQAMRLALQVDSAKTAQPPSETRGPDVHGGTR